MSNFFAVRDEIAEKLKEIPAFKQIYTPLNSVKVTEMAQVTPAAHVNFARFSPQAVASQGKATMLSMRWAVTVACQNAQSQMNDGSAVTDQAGNLLGEVIELLAGWKPESSRMPLVLVDAKEAFNPTFAYLTAVFESQQII